MWAGGGAAFLLMAHPSNQELVSLFISLSRLFWSRWWVWQYVSRFLGSVPTPSPLAGRPYFSSWLSTAFFIIVSIAEKEKVALRPGSCTSTSCSTNFLDLHGTCKRWCEWQPDVVLSPGTLEKGGYGLSRPWWEFRVYGILFRV